MCVWRIAGRAHVIVAINFHQTDFSQLSVLDDRFARFHQMRRAAPLHPHLHHPPIFARRGQHRLSFSDIHADRLLQ